MVKLSSHKRFESAATTTTTFRLNAKSVCRLTSYFYRPQPDASLRGEFRGSLIVIRWKCELLRQQIAAPNFYPVRKYGEFWVDPECYPTIKQTNHLISSRTVWCRWKEGEERIFTILVLKTLQFLNHCRSSINPIKQQKIMWTLTTDVSWHCKLSSSRLAFWYMSIYNFCVYSFVRHDQMQQFPKIEYRHGIKKTSTLSNGLE